MCLSIFLTQSFMLEKKTPTKQNKNKATFDIVGIVNKSNEKEWEKNLFVA